MALCPEKQLLNWGTRCAAHKFITGVFMTKDNISDTRACSDEAFQQYKIIIGADNIIEPARKLLEESLQDENTKRKAEEKLQEMLKEMRVRFGTLLKTDNVSFLMGAGSSIKAGGISLATIPKPLELSLIDKAENKEEKEQIPSWTLLFYRIVSVITREGYAFDNRRKLLKEAYEETNAISINLEDFMSHLHMWFAGIEDFGESVTLELPDSSKLEIKKDQLQDLIRHMTQALATLLDLPNGGAKGPLQYHRKFIKKVLTRPLNLRRANLYTLNYDTLIEQAADAEGAVLVDGFIGSLRRVFRPESYDLDFYFPAQTTEGRVHRFDRALHLYKLHGSINWHRCEQSWENPYGLYATFFDPNSSESDVLIYPSPLKYGQALGLPYSELFRRFGNSIAQPQSVLFTIGYGFGDEHVNALIRQALAIPSFTLVIVDPEPKSSFVRELEALKDERVWIIKGWELGTFEDFVNKLLPDLREEEIDAKVMKTFKMLSRPMQEEPKEEDSNGV